MPPAHRGRTSARPRPSTSRPCWPRTDSAGNGADRNDPIDQHSAEASTTTIPVEHSPAAAGQGQGRHPAEADQHAGQRQRPRPVAGPPPEQHQPERHEATSSAASPLDTYCCAIASMPLPLVRSNTPPRGAEELGRVIANGPGPCGRAAPRRGSAPPSRSASPRQWIGGTVSR